jgi:hypothetical protein
MKHLYVSTYRVPEGFQAGRDRVDGTGAFVVHDVPGEPCAHISRSNCAPAYYQGRPASLWSNVMKPRRRRSPRPTVPRAAIK